MSSADKAVRREARKRVDSYYVEQVSELISHVETAITAFRSGEIGASEIAENRDQDEDEREPSWWEQGAPRRRD